MAVGAHGDFPWLGPPWAHWTAPRRAQGSCVGGHSKASRVHAGVGGHPWVGPPCTPRSAAPTFPLPPCPLPGCDLILISAVFLPPPSLLPPLAAKSAGSYCDLELVSGAGCGFLKGAVGAPTNPLLLPQTTAQPCTGNPRDGGNWERGHRGDPKGTETGRGWKWSILQPRSHVLATVTTKRCEDEQRCSWPHVCVRTRVQTQRGSLRSCCLHPTVGVAHKPQIPRASPCPSVKVESQQG